MFLCKQINAEAFAMLANGGYTALVYPTNCWGIIRTDSKIGKANFIKSIIKADKTTKSGDKKKLGKIVSLTTAPHQLYVAYIQYGYNAKIEDWSLVTKTLTSVVNDLIDKGHTTIKLCIPMVKCFEESSKEFNQVCEQLETLAIDKDIHLHIDLACTFR